MTAFQYCPAYASRMASMMYRNGLIRATPCSQPGPSVIGSMMPDSRISGTTTEFTRGANASSLLIRSAVA